MFANSFIVYRQPAYYNLLIRLETDSHSTKHMTSDDYLSRGTVFSSKLWLCYLSLLTVDMKWSTDWSVIFLIHSMVNANNPTD